MTTGADMSTYTATVHWQRDEDELYTDNRYSRGHEWHFDGGARVSASASPHVVPLPYSIETHVDPEEAYVASLSSCHMLFFLSIAARNKCVIDEYLDEAVGIMEKDVDNKMSMTRVTLRPRIKFSGEDRPDRAKLEQMHHQAHEQCFIANSVKTEVTTEIIE